MLYDSIHMYIRCIYVGMYLCRDIKRDTFCDVHNEMVLRIDKQILFNKIKKILYRNFNV